MECGIGLGGFNDLKNGDLIEAYTTEKLAADLGALAIDVAKAAAAKAAAEAAAAAAVAAEAAPAVE
jgi:translation initiation factor IF-2